MEIEIIQRKGEEDLKRRNERGEQKEQKQNKIKIRDVA